MMARVKNILARPASRLAMRHAALPKPQRLSPFSGERSEKGLSLLETMVTLLIVLMVSVIVATGVPSAISAYRNAVAGSNAEVALSTMTTVLRDELGAATAVTPASGSTSGEFTIDTYTCGEGYKAKIENGSLGAHSPVKTTADPRLATTSWTLAPDAQLATTQDNLYVGFEKITFDPSEKVFKVYGLRVYEDQSGSERTITSVNTEGGESYFAVRAPYCTVESP